MFEFEPADIDEARADALELMIDSCVITRSSGDQVFNPETGQYESTVTTVYDGVCKVRSGGLQASTPEAGGATFTVVRREVHFPTTVDVRDGDIVELTDSVYAPILNGLKYRVAGFTPGSLDSAWRVPVEVLL